MAVQGATPSRIMPAMYSRADCGSTKDANTCSKNSTPSSAIVKGLINQLTTSVSTRPPGRRRTSFTADQSIWIIIG